MVSGQRGAMDYRILGPLEVRADGIRVPVDGPRQKALLAILLLHANEVVSRDRLISELWERPPESAENALHRIVSQLRKQLASNHGAPMPLVTRPPGYALEIEPDALDLHRFETLLAAGRAALLAADPEKAARTLRDALALWHGPALADLEDAAFARADIGRLAELRLQALEERIEADLQLGRERELVPELEALVAAEPFRERLRYQLMLALYRSGRQADALAAYRETRRRLVEELGIEPSPRLQELEQAILRQDAALEPPKMTRGAYQPKRRTAALIGVVLAGALVAGSVAAVLVLRADSGPKAIAAAPPNSVAVIDPETNRLVDYVRVGSKPIAVAVGEGAIWAVNTDDGTLSRIDPQTREVVRTIGLGTPSTDVATGFGSVWIANGTEGTVSRVDPRSNAVAETFQVRPRVGLVSPVASAIAVGFGSVWLTSGVRNVVRLEPRTGTVLASLSTPVEPVSVAAGEGAIWVSSVARRITRIEPITNAVTATLPVPATALAVAVGAGAVWTTVCCETVWRIDPLRNVVSQTISVGADPTSVAVGDGAVWITNAADGTVSRVDPGTNEVVETIPVGEGAIDVAVGYGAVWVAVEPPPS